METIRFPRRFGGFGREKESMRTAAPDEITVTKECGCAELWMPKMEDILDSKYCDAHMPSWMTDGSTSDHVFTITRENVGQVGDILLHYMGVHNYHAVIATKDPVTGEFVEDPTCMCGLPKLKPRLK